MRFGKVGAGDFGRLGVLGGAAGKAPFVVPGSPLFWRPLASGHAWTDSVWSLTDSGAAGTHAPPTAAQIAAFSSNDNSNCAISSASVCLDLYFNAALGWRGTLSGSSTLAVSGIFRGSPTANDTYTGTITFNSTSTGKTVTMAGAVLLSPVTFNGVGGGWTHQDNFTTSNTSQITLSHGAWHLGAKTITAGIISYSGTATRTFDANGATIIVNGGNSAPGTPFSAWVGDTTTLLTSDFTNSNIFITGRNGNFRSGSLTYNNVTISGGDANGITGSGVTFNNFTYTIANAGGLMNDLCNFPAAVTVNGTFTINGGSPQIRARMGGIGIAGATITANATSIANVDLYNITATNPMSGTSLGDMGGNTNITFDTPRTLRWVGNSGNQSDPAHCSLTSGGAGGVNIPLPQDTLKVDSGSVTLPGQVLTFDEPRCSALDFTGVLNNPTWAWGANPIYTGSLTLVAGMTVSGNGNFATFQNIAAGQIIMLTSNGVTLPGLIQLQNFSTLAGAELQLGDNLSAQQLIIRQGTFRDNGHNISLTTSFSTNFSTVVRSVIATGNWTVAGLTGTIWNANTSNLTWSFSGTLTLAGTGATAARTFAGGGLTYGGFTWADESSTFGLTFTGANSFGALTVAPSASARTLTLPASTTQTVTTTFSLNGQAGALLSIVSSTPGTPATISSALAITTDYLTIKDITFTGGGSWHAGAHSVDGGGNTGITFP